MLFSNVLYIRVCYSLNFNKNVDNTRWRLNYGFYIVKLNCQKCKWYKYQRKSANHHHRDSVTRFVHTMCYAQVMMTPQQQYLTWWGCDRVLFLPCDSCCCSVVTAAACRLASIWLRSASVKRGWRSSRLTTPEWPPRAASISIDELSWTK